MATATTVVVVVCGRAGFGGAGPPAMLCGHVVGFPQRRRETGFTGVFHGQLVNIHVRDLARSPFRIACLLAGVGGLPFFQRSRSLTEAVLSVCLFRNSSMSWRM